MLPALLVGLAAPPAGLIGWQASLSLGDQAAPAVVRGEEAVRGWWRPGLQLGKQVRPTLHVAGAVAPGIWSATDARGPLAHAEARWTPATLGGAYVGGGAGLVLPEPLFGTAAGTWDRPSAGPTAVLGWSHLVDSGVVVGLQGGAMWAGSPQIWANLQLGWRFELGR